MGSMEHSELLHLKMLTPVAVIALLACVLVDSEVLQVDTENLKVRPCLKRNVLILRDLPVGTTQEVC